jgi:hypothetical protein
MTDDLALVGLVRRAHGIRGEVTVETFTDRPAEVFSAGRRVFGGTPEGRVLPADPRRPLGAAARRSRSPWSAPRRSRAG